jgi:hypothetical protein
MRTLFVMIGVIMLLTLGLHLQLRPKTTIAARMDNSVLFLDMAALKQRKTELSVSILKTRQRLYFRSIDQVDDYSDIINLARLPKGLYLLQVKVGSRQWEQVFDTRKTEVPSYSIKL